MIRAVILDDEQHSVETLKWKLENYCPDVEVRGTFTDPMKALQYLKENSTDLLFLDIEMPMMSGFDVLEELKDLLDFNVIFITAYDSFGIKAIKFSALDYLLKPVQNKELIEAVEKHKERGDTELVKRQINHLKDNVEAEMQNLPGKIGLASKDSIEFVEPDDILYCEASSNYTNVYLKNATKRVISKTLKDFDLLLTGYGFFRPHKSFIVNLKYINEYQKHDGGYLVMSDKKSIPVSKARKDQLLKLLRN